MACPSRIDVTPRYVTLRLRATSGGSWDSAESSRIPGDREMTADRIHATLFGSTQRGAATGRFAPSYVHGGVAACLRTLHSVLGGWEYNSVPTFCIVFLLCGIFPRLLLALRIISQKAMRYLVKYISLYINTYVNKYIYTG